MRPKLKKDIANLNKKHHARFKLPAYHTFYEFFAGGGMARAGLGPNWQCLFANDFDSKKAASYIANWGNDHLVVEDVAKISSADLAGYADLVWASFPCQDLSLAGAGAGLAGGRSGTFWSFWNLIKSLKLEQRLPSIMVLENVCGALTSHNGKDFAAIGDALLELGYHFGAVVIDAIHFVPQSRPRLFIIGFCQNIPLSENLITPVPNSVWHTSSLIKAFYQLSEEAKANWLWFNLPQINKCKTVFSDLIEENPTGVNWHTPEETERLLTIMSPSNLQKVETAKKLKSRIVGTIYRRTRMEHGERVQRAEIRFDNVAGCLRTPLGGSSRQIIMIIEGSHIRSRLLSPREAARLMGLPDAYQLPVNYNDAYHLIGDGLAVPVVNFLAENLLEPLLRLLSGNQKEVA